MIFNAKNRFEFIRSAPKTGSFKEMILINLLIEKIKFSPEELKKMDHKEFSNGSFQMDLACGDSKEIDICDDDIYLFKEILKNLDETKCVTVDNLDLCIMFDNL